VTPICQRLTALLLLCTAACQTDMPTAGRDVWGRDEGDLALIPVGATLTEIVADPQRRLLYATDFDNGQLYVIDAVEGRVQLHMTIGSRPSDLSLDPAGQHLYVALSGGSEIAVIDLETLQRLPSIQLSFSPAYLAAGGGERFYVTSILEFWKGFTTYGQTYRVDGNDEQIIPTVGLLEVDVAAERLYVATHRSIYQYDISGPQAVLVAEVAAEGPILDLHLSDDGQRLYSVSTDFFATPEHVISHGLLNSQTNFEIDYVEAFSTTRMTKVAELYTGAFPRAVTSWGDRVVVAAGDSAHDARLSGFAVLYDAETLTPLSTHRLVGTPTSCATIDPSTGSLYIAVNNPYDIRERFGRRQDLQIVPLGAGAGTVSMNEGLAPGGDAAGTGGAEAGVVDAATDSVTTGGLGESFFWSAPGIVPHEMVLVPAGDFIMGANDGDADEQPVHAVYLDAFFIDAFEVTVAQYRVCVDAGACEPPTSASLCNWYASVPEDHPINCMYWNDAGAYCRWADLRLPTEAEWEKAARGVDGRTFPWGEDFDRDKANYGDGGIMRTTPVHDYADGVSPYGAWDMAGNVWDWVDDWYHEHYYSNSPASNPTGPDSGSLRVLRGGSHWFDANMMRATSREPYHPQQTDVDIGFRCGRDAAAVPTPQRR